MYFDKNTILWTYKKLSTLTDSPSAQGATQTVSAIKYFLSLCAFYNKYGRACNTQNSEDKKEFINFVGDIVSINEQYHTKNFYTSFSDNNRDYDVGSNFLSVGILYKSLGTNEVLTYPRRTNGKELFAVRKGILSLDNALMANFDNYFPNAEHKVALLLWLGRNNSFNKDAEESPNSFLQELTFFIAQHYGLLFSSDFITKEVEDILTEVYTHTIHFVDAQQQLTIEEIQSAFVATNHSSLTPSPLPLQQIFYGAPGTGKSHIINQETAGESVVRTTFHPDSDYSNFVGAYKPTTKVVQLRDMSGHIIEINGEEITEERISYEFVPQAFLQAYVRAWKLVAEAKEETAPRRQFLIVEEINRGNCAQIFGDLFQLLDRNEEGFSDYPITADNDMRKQLAKAFQGMEIPMAEEINALYHEPNMTEQVLRGEKLLLPNNLFIWATMNTSDQSLFPIDSAFKRRWDWQYMPIDQGKDEAGRPLEWVISVGQHEYDWWQFISAVNRQIQEATQSEDKKLGFFFCKAQNGKISAKRFVGKVLFYLWNDVFKDMAQEDEGIFRNIPFDAFYQTGEAGKVEVCLEKVDSFLEGLGLVALEN